MQIDTYSKEVGYMHVVALLVCTLVVVLIMCFIFYIFDYFHSMAGRKKVSAMNMKVVDFDHSGWLVLIDISSKVVGLYEDGHAISHSKIYIKDNIVDQVDFDNVLRMTIGDFRKFDVDLPRFSYRVLYEYEVPHSTPVIVYSSK